MEHSTFRFSSAAGDQTSAQGYGWASGGGYNTVLFPLGRLAAAIEHYRLLHEIRHWPPHCRSWFDRESGFEHAHLEPRARDSAARHFCRGPVRVLERGTQFARCAVLI